MLSESPNSTGRMKSQSHGKLGTGSVASSAEGTSNSGGAGPVWVAHTPTPDDTSSTNGPPSTPPYTEKTNNHSKGSLKSRLQTLLPESWALLKLKRESSGTDSEASTGGIQILPNGTRVSPPVSPLIGKKRDISLGTLSQNSDLLRDSDLFQQEESLLTSIHPAEYYAEKLEVYNLKYAYLKSWPGLLRLLAGLQLLFGGMVFACVIAYIHKDSEWSNSYGMYNGAYNNGFGSSGYSYRGPMTPYILAIAGLSWIVTLVLLVMGMTMYYRTILLDASWWPLTEAFINVALFLLYMSAGIVYLNDLNRGGLCYTTIGVNPIVASLCRVDGGQIAGTAFIFINMTLYLGSFLVCLKMWRHEAARREREYFLTETKEVPSSILMVPQKPKRISFRDEMDKSKTHDSEVQRQPLNPILTKKQKNKYKPEVHIVADYIMKYPEISCFEERERYRAVFNDQYQEYKDLHREISLTLSKFREMDAMMVRLLRDANSHQNVQRIQNILQKYQEKKNDPAFCEKRERCDYLKAKLSHLKHRIHTYDQMNIVDSEK